MLREIRTVLNVVLPLLVVLALFPCGHSLAETPPSNDDKKHPIYAAYQFGASDRTIDFGIQPLWIPIALVSEVIRRDRILQKQLSDRGTESKPPAYTAGLLAFVKGVKA